MTREEFWEKQDASIEGGDYTRALELANQRLKSIPGDVDATIALCRLWIKRGRLDAAMDTLGQVEDKIAKLADVFSAIGDICLEAGLLEEAAHYYRRFLAVKPSSPATDEVKLKVAALMDRTNTEGQEEEPDEDKAAPLFCTLSMADLYISQEHWDNAWKVLDVLARQEDMREAVETRFALIRQKRDAKIQKTIAAQNRERLLGKLELWHQNALRMMGHAV